MAIKGLKDVIKRERSRNVHPRYDIEQWFDDAVRKPFSMFGSSLWPEMGGESFETLPNVDLYEEGNEMVLNVDLPGIKKEDIKIDLSENILTITGEKKRKEEFEKECYYRCERSFGSFMRRFELPRDMDIDKINAHYENGVLELRIPTMHVEKKHTKIAVN